MNDERVGEELMAALTAAGVEVRVIALTREMPGTQSGVATWGGRTALFLDVNLPDWERNAIVARALRGLDLENVFLSPAARALVEEA